MVEKYDDLFFEMDEKENKLPLNIIVVNDNLKQKGILQY